MKIVEWFRNLLSKNKKDYMLNQGIVTNDVMQHKKEFVQKVNVDDLEHNKTREDILMSLRDDIIVKDLSEHNNYTKFSRQNIRLRYDEGAILSEEDLTAIECLYGAIKEGNWEEWKHVNEKIENNIINNFLEENTNNIVTLVDLMIKDAHNSYEGLEDEIKKETTIIGQIPGSYSDVSTIIDEYKKEKDIEILGR